jgi:sulfide:quinone oxidoreductase
MSGSSILVLGGGLGGITAAAHLRRLLPPEHRVTVVERRAAFSLCMANLWLMTGERQDPRLGERALSALGARGIEVVAGEVEAILPEARAARTSAGTFEADYLIVALGAEKAPASLPGFAESALNLYDRDGALQIRRALDEFNGGRIVVLITRTPFSCPAAPYEAALLLDSVLRRRRVRGQSQVAVYTPEDLPMPVAGSQVGRALVSLLDERGVEFHAEQVAMKVQPERRRVLFELDEVSYDLLVGVPPHRAPAVVRDSGLTDASGWVAVDAATLRTRYAGVYAIGDVTAVRLANGMFLPKAGVFADAEARVVANAIAAEVSGAGTAPSYDGRGFCFIEVGDGKAAYGAGDFYGLPGPRVHLQPPSDRYRREKEGQERDALALWDGL